MNKISLLIISLLLLISGSLFSQNNDWQVLPENSNTKQFLMKQDGNITYIVDSTLNPIQRKDVIRSTKEYISQDLNILDETAFNKPLVVLFISTKDEMYKRFGEKKSSIIKDNNFIICVYDAKYSSLNRQLMNMILTDKWGILIDSQLVWLKEGLITFANPEADNCDGYTIEQRYTYFLQNDKLLDITSFTDKRISDYDKTTSNQFTYLVEYLIQHYGIEKLKLLWNQGIANFENIYEIKLSILIEKINQELNKKYPNPILFNWEQFIKDCIDPQPNDWLPEYEPDILFPRFNNMVTKEFGRLRFTIDSSISIDKRSEIVENTIKYITQNLALINETGFNDSLHIVIAKNRQEMGERLGVFRVGGLFIPQHPNGLLNSLAPSVNTIYAIYNDSYTTLKHELMHAILYSKWGEVAKGEGRLDWIFEGLPTFFDPQTNNCDGHTFEERYVFFLQNNKLLSSKKLITFPDIEEKPKINIAYNQSAYLVGRLVERYGIKKVKVLWQSKNMNDFEAIYGITFEQMISNINKELNEKYTKPMKCNWEIFKKGCIE